MKNLIEEIKEEMSRQMAADGVAFNVTDLDAAIKQRQDGAEYIASEYDEPTAPEKVASWLVDAKMYYPEEFKRI